MAVFPCDWSAHRYPGPQRSMYYTRIYDNEPETYKLRLCQRHFDDMLLVVRKVCSEVADDSQISVTCEECGAIRQGGVFIKVFDLGHEPTTFASDLCTACIVKLEHGLHIASGRALTGR